MECSHDDIDLTFLKLTFVRPFQYLRVHCSGKAKTPVLKTSKKMFKSAIFNLQEASKDQVKEFLNSFDTVLSDCDGVLWINNNAIPGSAEAMNFFRNLGKKIFYVTNNSTKTRSEFALKAQQLGFIAEPEDILSTAYLVAHYLRGIGFRKKVYLVGSSGIGDELKAVGIRHIGIGPDPVKQDFKSMTTSELDPEVGAVVVGFDEHVSYPKFMKAASYLANEECLFVATNTDERFPKSSSIIIPGTGTLVRAVETCSERKALVLGKPNDYVRKFLESFGLDPARTLMIGDRCNTDIEFGVRCGFQTLLVKTGVTNDKDVERMRIERRSPVPDVVLPKLGDIINLASS
ncbi:glycerol-3-phosphate phosphatase-like [Melitaea cinxia]|uniref:glycerol-3-phosphate phosphatase-like n=1 Tax=Melitaea cinxia TaxID=113334 RepID=UPI001E26EFBD|nr:glycerol-3-phosphate phosphatase-like [Melitaea cinxia]